MRAGREHPAARQDQNHPGAALRRRCANTLAPISNRSEIQVGVTVRSVHGHSDNLRFGPHRERHEGMRPPLVEGREGAPRDRVQATPGRGGQRETSGARASNPAMDSSISREGYCGSRIRRLARTTAKRRLAGSAATAVTISRARRCASWRCASRAPAPQSSGSEAVAGRPGRRLALRLIRRFALMRPQCSSPVFEWRDAIRRKGHSPHRRWETPL